MTFSAIISDWNGTLYRSPDEEAFLRAIAMELAKSCVPWHPIKLARFIQTKKKLEDLILKNTQESDHVIEIYRIYNKEVIEGTSVSLIQRLVERYACLPKVQRKIMHEMLRPISEVRHRGITTGILSAGYKYGIQMILKAASYDDCFDFCEANSLADSDGRAAGFTLDIYKNKADRLTDLLERENIDPNNMVYIGDSMDDAGCFDIAGFPIVSILTQEELKEEFAAKYRAFAPEDESDLKKYLNSLY